MNTVLNHEMIVMPQNNIPIKIHHRETNSYSKGCEFHWHEQIEFYYVERGGLLLLCNGEKKWLHRNDIAIVNCHEPHRSLEFLDNSFHYCIQIDLSILSSGSWDICLEKYLQPLTSRSILFTKWIHEDLTLGFILKEIIEEYKNAQFGYELSIKSHFMNFFTLLYRNYLVTNRATIKEIGNSLELKHIIKITSFISQNFNKTITLQELANECLLSVPYLCKIFKKYTGTTIVEYINQLRCQRALSLIACGYSIMDTALTVGFNDSNYFSRIFKRVMGISPSKFKADTINILNS